MAHGATAAVPAGFSRDAADPDLPVQLPKYSVEDAKLKSPSSPKFTQPLRDVPQTIVVIPNSVYVEQGATSLRDVLRNTPGITFVAGEGGNAPGDNLFIRGFNARNDIFVDGVRDPGVYSRDSFNTEQVEVAKGPASAITGRGSTGGSVNQISKFARLGDFTTVQATAGSADYGRVTVDTNQELSASPIAGTVLRLNGVWTDAGIVGRDEVKNRNSGAASSLAFGLGTPTQLTLNYQHLHQNNLPDYGLPAVAETDPRIPWSNFYGLIRRDYEHVNSDLGTAIVEHKVVGTDSSNFTLRNLTRFGRNTRDAVVTPPRTATATPLDPSIDPATEARRDDVKFQDRVDEILANQTGITGKFESGLLKHTFATGLEFSREQTENYAKARNTTGFTPQQIQQPTSLFAPTPDDQPLGAITLTGARTEAVADSAAAYAFDTLQFGPRWELTGGARLERFNVDYRSLAANGTAVAGFPLQRTDDMLSWRAGLVYKPTPYGSFYTGYGTSFNPAADGNAGLVLSTTGNNNAALAPEENRGFELGTKWELSQRRLIVSAAVFRTEKTNARTTDAAGNTVLAGDQQVAGVELDVAGKITDAWSVFGGYVYMDSAVKSSGVAQQVDAELTYVPRQSANLWTTYRLPLGLTLGGGAQFTDGYYFGLPTATATPAIVPQTRYWLLSAMAAYEVNKHLSLRLNVNNLADTRYIERGYAAHFTPGPGRTILFTTTINF